MAKSTVDIGILGCGSMGRELALAADGAVIEAARVVALFDEYEPALTGLSAALSGEVRVYSDMSEFAAHPGLDLVVECASLAAARSHAATILRAGVSVMLMSSGALLDGEIYGEIIAASRECGGSVIVPSGAIGGIDAIRAVSHLLESVTLTTTKPPVALKGAPGFASWEQARIDAPTVVFDGPAAEAVSLFPANVNVAATLSLSGIGPDRTIVKVVADPAAPGNVHEIEASGSFGRLHFTFVNEPHPDNPKTSHLAALAAIEALRVYCQPGLRIGT